MPTNIRQITYAKAINEALELCLKHHPKVFLIGEGVPDAKGIFGTTINLQKKFGKTRVLDMPVSENGLTGICIGTAISGMRPILTHQRVDFSLLSADQIINNAAKWWYMFGGKQSVPIVIRMIIGQGWGQGAQHSQSLQALFAHIPGLKVVMPTTPYDAKGMLITAVNDDNPVIFIEHRWLHNLIGEVPEKYYTANLHQSQIVKSGTDMTLVGVSLMTIEAIKAEKILHKLGINVELLDLRCLKPLDTKTILNSVLKTRRLLVADTGYASYGVASEIIALASTQMFNKWKASPQKITLPDLPTPTSWTAAKKYYPNYLDIVKFALRMFNKSEGEINKILKQNRLPYTHPSDIPDPLFTGPF